MGKVVERAHVQCITEIATGIYALVLKSPKIANRVQPGQFVAFGNTQYYQRTESFEVF